MQRTVYGEHDYAFGRLMLTLRTNIGLTQAGLAERLGVSGRAVVEWEAGNSYPKAERLKAFIELCVHASAFAAGREAEEIRALWRAAHQKVLLDEQWLQTLLGVHRPQPVPVASLPGKPTRATDQAVSRPEQEPRVDWGEALAVSSFYDREEEVASVSQWVVQERCRVVSVLGLGGIGKSALATRVMHQVAPHFQVVIWRSLRDAPACSVLLEDCLQVLAPQPLREMPSSLERRLGLLLEHLREERSLLVLDNLESLLEEGAGSGHMRAGYEDYGRLLRRVAETEHQSCLLLTSREKPRELVPLEGSRSPVHALRLSGLNAVAGAQLLAEKEVAGPLQDRERLAEAYGGNPLALKIVAQTIVELFGNELAPFLEQGEAVFGGVRELLDEQFARLSATEQTVLLWLAILREPVTIEELLAVLGTPLPRMQVLEAVEALRRRSLIEPGQRRGSFTLQSVVLEYATTRLIAEAASEIEQSTLSRLIEHGLEQATAKEYVRQTQQRLLVAPLLAHLRGLYRGREEVEAHLLSLLDLLRERADYAQGYGPANLVALLREQRGHLRGLDLSQLVIRGASLQGVDMQDTMLAGAMLHDVVFTEAFDAVLSVAVSPDGRYIAAGSNSGQVRVWREEGWVAHLTMRAHSDRVGAIAFSPDGQTLVTASWDGTVKLWDLASGATIWTGRDHTVPVTSLALSPTGKLISGRYDGAMHLWDLRTGTKLSRLHTQGGPILTVACSRDGRWLASGGLDAVIRLWDADQGILLQELREHRDPVLALAFAPETSLLASGSVDQAVKLWDVATGTCRMTLEGHSSVVTGLAWAPDGHTLASASYDTTIRLWDRKTWQCRHLLQGHTDAVTSVAFLPRGDRLLSGSLDRTVRTWDVRSGQQVHTMAGYAIAVFALCWSSDGRFILSGSSEATLMRWNVATRTPVQVLRGHRQYVYTVAWSRATNRIASGGIDQTVRIWDAETGACTHILQGHTALVFSVDWSADGRWLASGAYDGSVRLWDLQAGTSRLGREQTGPVNAAMWSPDGTFVASGSEDGLVLVSRAADGDLLQRFEHAGPVDALCWSPNGEQLVSGAVEGEKGVLRIWDVRQGRLVRTFEGHRGFIWGIEWSRERDLLVSAGADGTVRWWNPQQGTSDAVVQAHDAWARAVRISPDGKTVASCGEDGVIKLWEMHSHQHLATLRAERPYERLDISGTLGLTNAQQATLRALGAWSADNGTPPLV